MTDNIKENRILLNRTGAKHYNKHVLLCFLSFFRFYFHPLFTVVQGCIIFVNIMGFSLWSWQHDRKFLRRKYSKFPHNVNCKLLGSLHLCQWGHIDTFNMDYRQALLVDVSWIHKPQQSMKLLIVLPRGRVLSGVLSWGSWEGSQIFQQHFRFLCLNLAKINLSIMRSLIWCNTFEFASHFNTALVSHMLIYQDGPGFG